MAMQNKFLLAPMAGYSDAGFREVCADFGADVTFTEMLSAQAIKYDSEKTKALAFRASGEKTCIAQIFGKDADTMAQACENQLLKCFDGIDINMGCPAPKIVKNGEGSALLKNLPLASKIISECRHKVQNKSLSVKVRLGFDENNIVEIVKMCEDSGADFVTVHGRTAKQMYSGRANLDAIALAKASVKIPVFGNGDVTDAQTCAGMLATGVDGVMIGRGAIGSPWIFSQLKNRSGDIDKIQAISKHVEILRQIYPERLLVLMLRKHFLAYAAKLHAPAKERQKFALQTNIDESLKLFQSLVNHFENQ